MGGSLIPELCQQGASTTHEMTWEVFARTLSCPPGFCEQAEPATSADRETLFLARRDEFSFVVFAASSRTLPAAAPCRDGALDADAGGAVKLRAAGGECGMLP